MAKLWEFDGIGAYLGHVLEVLPTLPAGSVQCVVTSPPYWGLRDYGTARWDGGDPACDHKPEIQSRDERPRGGLTGGLDYLKSQEPIFKDVCGKCGAVRIDGQLGLERTPEEFVANMVAVFREVRRVLRDDGTLWLNIGDSYNAAGREGHGTRIGYKQQTNRASGNGTDSNRPTDPGLKPKDLIGIPWKLAFALQADGWWLRSEIIWAKPNPMPESVTDRPTKAHEQIFLLTKAERYFYDAEAVREPHQDKNGLDRFKGNCGIGERTDGQGWSRGEVHLDKNRDYNPAGRNLRTVWTIPTQPYPGSHFATFPEELAERCIKAGTSERGACSQCGRPWVRITDREFIPQPDVSPERAAKGSGKGLDDSNGWADTPRGSVATKTTGWAPGCDCKAEPAPCLVLDPFFGSGTVGRVCRHLRRNCIGIDLNADYLGNQARARVSAPLDRDVAKQAESIPGQKTMF